MSSEPFVSFVFPVHIGGMPLLQRTLRELNRQTDRDFEAIVAVDSPLDELKKLEPPVLDVCVVPSPRTQGNEHLPHRNHARNAGCRAARGQHLWVLDADMIPDPHAVEHLKAIVASSPKPVCASPCFAQPKISPAMWTSYTGDPWAAPLEEYVTHSGRMREHVPGPPNAADGRGLVEGFPSCPRWLWEALEGYDERYLGYGGNKVDFVRQLKRLNKEEVIDLRILRSCLFLHQPHERDPLRFDEAHRARNWELFRERKSQISSNASWWAAKSQAVRRAAQAHGFPRPCST